MSRQAIAAALARSDLAAGERLVAFSLASFGGRDNRSWPGTPAAAARAGLSRSRYLQTREALVRRRLLVVEERAAGRGRASTIALAFADAGPWWEGEINVELFEAVLGYSSARGPARLLLAAMAAVSDEFGEVRDLSTEQLSAAAGIADRSYRRARQELLATGALVLASGVGGRGNTNVWSVPDPRQTEGARAHRVPRRMVPPPGARPLVATAGGMGAPLAVDDRFAAARKGGQDQMVSAERCPIVTGVSLVKGGQDQTGPPQKCPIVAGVSGKGGQDQTLFQLPEPETPAKTPAARARAGKEPQNPKTKDPPTPPEGGSPSESIVIEQPYRTAAGRRRSRPVRVDLAEVRRGLGLPAAEDRAGWERIRSMLLEAVGDSTFALWIEPLELIAVDRSGALVVAAPTEMVSWVRERFGRIIAGCAERAGHQLRLADESERRALGPNDGRAGAVFAVAPEINQTEVS